MILTRREFASVVAAVPVVAVCALAGPRDDTDYLQACIDTDAVPEPGEYVIRRGLRVASGKKLQMGQCTLIIAEEAPYAVAFTEPNGRKVVYGLRRERRQKDRTP